MTLFLVLSTHCCHSIVSHWKTSKTVKLFPRNLCLGVLFCFFFFLKKKEISVEIFVVIFKSRNFAIFTLYKSPLNLSATFKKHSTNKSL